ncbi:MAG: transglycosylase SLT domain-containing protein [Candidatus Pacebacteria bacterium]|jgi:hypothetical protein|nr:transglycosylase SLT domain-containing protein [Candidatus Paceibacterota bacterium]
MAHGGPEKVDLVRRGLALGGTAAVVAAAVPGVLRYQKEQNIADEVAVPEEELPVHVEQNEALIESPVFDEVLKARVIEMSELSRDQVLFVDQFGRPLSNGIKKVTKAAGYTPEEMTWRYKGGKAVGITPTWTKMQKALLAKETGVSVDDMQMRHVYKDLVKDEYQSFENKVELALHYAGQLALGDNRERTVIEVLEEDVTLTGLSEPIRTWMKEQIIGIAAEESRFDPEKTSPADAKGVLQTMPDTEAGYRTKHKLESLDPKNLIEQVKVAQMHIESTYEYFERNLSTELQYIEKAFFGNDTPSFEKYFLMPLMINAYNAGQARMGEVVRWFVAQCTDIESVLALGFESNFPQGYDVFYAMTHQCAQQKGVSRYGDDARAYVEKVMAWTEAIKTRRQDVAREVTVASL